MDSDNLALGLLRASFCFQLPTLFEASERMLVTSVNEESSSKFYSIAEEVGANMLAEKCLQFKRIQCDNSLSEVAGKSDNAVNTNLYDLQLDEYEAMSVRLIVKIIDYENDKISN